MMTWNFYLLAFTKYLFKWKNVVKAFFLINKIERHMLPVSSLGSFFICINFVLLSLIS